MFEIIKLLLITIIGFSIFYFLSSHFDDKTAEYFNKGKILYCESNVLRLKIDNKDWILKMKGSGENIYPYIFENIHDDNKYFHIRECSETK